MRENGLRDDMHGGGLPHGEAERRSRPVDPEIWSKAVGAHEPELTLLCVQALRRELDRDEMKWRADEVAGRVRATYRAILGARTAEAAFGHPCAPRRCDATD